MIRKEKENDSLEKTNNSPRNDNSSKEMFERKNNEMIRRKLDTKEEERVVNQERRDNSKKSNSLKEEIDERLKSIERTMIHTQNDSLAELTKIIL